jgi:hypothetical protein
MARSKADMKWNKKRALKRLTEAATGDILSYFDIKFITELIVDASPIGLGAILVQLNPVEKEDVSIISYASRSLNDVERRYAHIEKECFAMVWGGVRNFTYIGREFTIVLDSKALVFFFGNPSKRTPARIERWSLMFMPYDFKVRHSPGFENPSDYLSRQPMPIKIGIKMMLMII